MPVVSAKHLHKAYGARVVLSDAEVTVRTGERVGVVGKNGAGKSTLARILAGVEAPDRGTVSRRRGATVQYLDQVPHFDGDPTAEEAVASGLAAWSEALERHAALSRALSDAAGDVDALVAEQQEVTEDIERLGGFDRSHEVSALLGRLGIDRPGARVSTLSGGEQRRVALARVLIANPDLTILDEPTNHLDAETVEWLEQRWLGDPRGALVLITHDRYLLDRVCDRLLSLDGAGGHDHFADLAQWEDRTAERAKAAGSKKSSAQKSGRPGLGYEERKELGKVEGRIEKAEAALAAAEEALSDPAIASDVSELQKRQSVVDEARAEVERLLARWEELGSRA